MAKVTIQEAAQTLGISVATVRRKLHTGVLKGTQEDPPTGRWWVELPDEGAFHENDSEPYTDDCADLRETVAILREELEAKNKQIEQLHVLLQQAQAALPAPRENRAWWHRLWHRNGR
jgi:predicted ArsR family transcriptional regulator